MGARRGSGPRIAAAAAAIAAASAFGAAAALDWPVFPQRIASTFGSPAAGRMVTGVHLASEGGLVKASEEGELSFHLEEGRHPSGLPTPLGSLVVVEHGKELAAVYAHLAPGSASTYLDAVPSGAILGRAGSSGWAEGSGALFEVFDRREGHWVNPLLLLPPLADDKPPIIRSLALSREGIIHVVGTASRLQQGSYILSVDVADPADSPWTTGPLAPYQIRLALDGVEISRRIFDVARGSGGELLFFSGEGFSSSALRTAEGRWIIAELLLPRGRISLELRVEDAAGNRRASAWTLAVE